METAELVFAPELMLTEVANTLWRLQRAGQLQAASLQARLRRAADLIDHIEPDRTLQAEALALATHLDHPVYDCLYLVLARREVGLAAERRPTPAGSGPKGAALKGPLRASGCS